MLQIYIAARAPRLIDHVRLARLAAAAAAWAGLAAATTAGAGWVSSAGGSHGRTCDECKAGAPPVARVPRAAGRHNALQLRATPLRPGSQRHPLVRRVSPELRAGSSRSVGARGRHAQPYGRLSSAEHHGGG